MSSNVPLPTTDNLGEYLFQINVLSTVNKNKSFVIYFVIPKLNDTLISNCVELAFSGKFDIEESPEIKDMKFKMLGTSSNINEADWSWIKVKDNMPVAQYRFVDFINDMTQKHVLPFLQNFSLACGGKEIFPDNKKCIHFLNTEMVKVLNSFEQKEILSPYIEQEYLSHVVESIEHHEKFHRYVELNKKFDSENSKTKTNKL